MLYSLTLDFTKFYQHFAKEILILNDMAGSLTSFLMDSRRSQTSCGGMVSSVARLASRRFRLLGAPSCGVDKVDLSCPELVGESDNQLADTEESRSTMRLSPRAESEKLVEQEIAGCWGKIFGSFVASSANILGTSTCPGAPRPPEPSHAGCKSAGDHARFQRVLDRKIFIAPAPEEAINEDPVC